MQRFSSIALSFVFFSGVSFMPAPAAPPVRDHDIVPEDYFGIGTILACAVSPDGGYIAYTENRWGKPKEKRTTDLWVVECSTHTRRRLTFDRVGAGSPTWSPDGKYIYFTGRFTRPGQEAPPYDGSTQVWRISLEGGEPLPVTRVEDGVGKFVLAKTGCTLLYTRSTEHVSDEWKDLQKKYEDLEYGHGVTDYSQVWSLDLESWWEKKLVDDKRFIRDMALSPYFNALPEAFRILCLQQSD